MTPVYPFTDSDGLTTLFTCFKVDYVEDAGLVQTPNYEVVDLHSDCDTCLIGREKM